MMWKFPDLRYNNLMKHVFRGIHRHNPLIVHLFHTEWWAWHGWAGRTSKAGWLETVGCMSHSQRSHSNQSSNPPTFSDLFEYSVFPPVPVNYRHGHINFSLALTGEMGRDRRFINMAMGDIETMTIHSIVERLSSFTLKIETTDSDRPSERELESASHWL